MTYNWKSLVKMACECYGDNAKFWKKFNILSGGKDTKIQYLIKSTENEDSEDDENYGEIINEVITDSKEQVNLMSEIWQEIFKENQTNEDTNENIEKVESWYRDNISYMKYDKYINYEKYPVNHPLLRPITLAELNNTIKHTKNKAPGPSGIRIPQFKHLPNNCKQILLNIFNGISVTQYFPPCLENIKMIFIKKPSKDPTNPKNYRPICLLEITLKLYEKIFAGRLQYFMEHNNLYSERQFGFRQNRNTQHAITLALTAIESYKKTNKTVLIASRDVQKAFDTV